MKILFVGSLWALKKNERDKQRYAQELIAMIDWHSIHF